MTAPTIRLGIVGLGAMGREMLDVASQHPDFVVTHAADLDARAVAEVGAQHPEILVGTDPLTLIDDDDLDAVYIATPPRTHAALVTRALRAGIAVFCEKPLAIDLAEGEAMTALARESGAVNAINFALSDRAGARRLDDELRAGALGEIVGVDIDLAFPRWPRDFQATATWLARREQGGFVREVFSHFAFLTDMLLGPMEVVAASLQQPSSDAAAAETSAIGEFRCGSVPVRFRGLAGVALPETYSYTVIGTEKSLRLRDWGDLEESVGGSPWTAVELTGERGSEHTRLSRFARAIRGERVEHLADFAAGLRVQRVVESFRPTGEVDAVTARGGSRRP